MAENGKNHMRQNGNLAPKLLATVYAVHIRYDILCHFAKHLHPVVLHIRSVNVPG